MFRVKHFLLILLTLVSFSNFGSLALKCKGYSNEDVDWFMVYKLPRLVESNDLSIRDGDAYMYMTSESPTWVLSKNRISSEKSIIGNTLAPMYEDVNSSNLFWFLYNDQAPNKYHSSKYGHAKGAVVVNKDEGFWLVHSVPNFPPVPFSGKTKGTHVSPKVKDPPEGKYGYPDSGLTNGQSFLCISIKNNEFDNVGLQLIYNQVIVYRNKIPKMFVSKFVNLVSAAKQVRINNAPLHRMSNISVNGHQFISFAKNSKWNKDLYDDFVAPELNTDILAETWLNGPEKMPSDCNATKVYNVHGIYVGILQTYFKSSVDHSKWAVAMTDKKDWVCVGDINRSRTQFKRGGGTVCYKNPSVWKSYRSLVHDIEPCPLGKRKQKN